MAGTVVLSTLNDSSGVLATQNGMTGIAKAWVNFDGTNGTVNSSFNVSSVTYHAAGDYTVNFTTALPNANYAVAGFARNTLGGGVLTICQTNTRTTFTTTACAIQQGIQGLGFYQATATCVAFFSS